MIRFVPLLLVAAARLGAETFTGVITDSACVTNHRMPDSACIEACLKLDKATKYVLFDGKNAYKLSDQETPARFAAKRVKVTGQLYEKTRIIKVERIEAVR